MMCVLYLRLHTKSLKSEQFSNVVYRGGKSKVSPHGGRKLTSTAWPHLWSLISWLICSIFGKAFSSLYYIASVMWKDDTWMINWKGCGRNRSWPNFRNYPGIWLGKLRETTKNLSQDSRSPGKAFKRDLPNTEQERETLDYDVRCLDRNDQF
jgi:hypothetical protein